MRKIVVGVILLALAGSGLAAMPGSTPIRRGGARVDERSTKLLPVGELAPEWQLNDAEGQTHALSEYRGKVVVLDFWATWCGPCSTVMARMQKLHEKLKERGVVVIGVNSWEQNDPVEVMKKKGYDYKLLLKGEEIADAYGVTTLPAVYVIGADGKVIYRHEGLDDKNLSSLIEKYFKESGHTGLL